MSIQVVANYPEYGFTVLEDEIGQFLHLAEGNVIVPLKDKPKTSLKSLLQFARPKVAAVERSFA